MIDTKRVFERLAAGPNPEVEFDSEPTKAEIRGVVKEYKGRGLCGRRIAEQHLGPYFLASDEYGQREIELLDEVLEEEYEKASLCVRDRQSECSRLRGGCKRYRN